VDIPKQVIGYSRIQITTLKAFKGSFSRTLSGKPQKWVSPKSYKGGLSNSAFGTEG
jgi:hypothetical protein